MAYSTLKKFTKSHWVDMEKKSQWQIQQTFIRKLFLDFITLNLCRKWTTIYVTFMNPFLSAKLTKVMVRS